MAVEIPDYEDNVSPEALRRIRHSEFITGHFWLKMDIPVPKVPEWGMGFFQDETVCEPPLRSRMQLILRPALCTCHDGQSSRTGV